MDTKSLKIGRKGQQSQQLEDRTVSALHAELSFKEGAEGSYRIRLLNIDNSLFVNGQSIIVSDCKPGDVVTVGDNRILLDLDLAIADLLRLNGKEPEQHEEQEQEQSASEEVRYSEVIPAQKTDDKKPERNVEESTGDLHIDPALLDKLDGLYKGYEGFTRKENLMGFLAKLANGVPVLLLLVLRSGSIIEMSTATLVICFLAAQSAAIWLLQEQARGSRKRTARFMAQFRNEYRIPGLPEKAMFYPGTNLPVPADEIRNGAETGTWWLYNRKK